MRHESGSRPAHGAMQLVGAKAAIAFGFAALVGVTAAGAQKARLVRFDDMGPHEMRAAAFELEAPADIRIDAVGADPSTRHNKWVGKMARLFDIPLGDAADAWPGNAWILNAATRETVWELRRSATRDVGDGVRAFDGVVRLEPGIYEVYYASYSGEREWLGDDWDRDSGMAQARWEDGGLSREFRLEVSGEGRTLDALALAEARAGFRRDAFVSVPADGPDILFRRGFELNAPTTVEVYAVGEASGGDAYDAARIVKVDDLSTIWQLDGRSAHAGGAEKNRTSHERVQLSPGRYAIMASTDDSHDPSDWNAPPPHDPAFWGVLLKTPALNAAIPTFDYDPTPADRTILALNKAGNRATLARGFTLPRSARVQILALGEVTGRELHDHGWIVDAADGHTVWAMRAGETVHAGGGAKNRMQTATLALDAGDYLAYYVTDGSHAYGDWNTAPPMDPEDWGLTILAGEGLKAADVATFDERNLPGTLARLTRMRDREDARATFTVEADGAVRVRAIGEGSGGTMHDYAWIENAEGRTVWEMTYRMTEHAGGAAKNRAFNGMVHLPAGRYTVRFRSDGSHAFGDWNASAPTDPLSWGVTVSQPRR